MERRGMRQFDTRKERKIFNLPQGTIVRVRILTNGPERVKIRNASKALCGGKSAGRSPVVRGKQGTKRSTVVDANGMSLGAITARDDRHD